MLYIVYRILSLIDIISNNSDIKKTISHGCLRLLIKDVPPLCCLGNGVILINRTLRPPPSSSQILMFCRAEESQPPPVFRTEFLPLNTAELLIIWNSHRECHQSKFNAYLLQNVDAPSRSNEYAKVFSADERRLPRKYREF